MDKNQGYEIIKAVMLENGRGFALGHHPIVRMNDLLLDCQRGGLYETVK